MKTVKTVKMAHMALFFHWPFFLKKKVVWHMGSVLEAEWSPRFRGLAVFPVEDLQDARLVVLRADYRGGLVLEVVQGQRWEPGGWNIVALIWKGHMTLLQPPEGFDMDGFLEREEHASTPSLGFAFFWHTRHDQPRSAPGKLACRLCRPNRRSGEVCEAYVRPYSYLSQAATMAGGATTMSVVRVLRQCKGDASLVLQELFAGHGGITKEWRANGQALEPVELYEDPHLRRGRRAHHDLSDPAVQQQHLEAVTDPEGPNVGWVACPCTSYCDWQLQNGGSRTFGQPEGTGQGPLAAAEELGNNLSRFGARYFEAMLDAGGFPVAESSAPSGRYPKQWDLPEWKRVLSRSDGWISLCVRFGLDRRTVTMSTMYIVLGWCSLLTDHWPYTFSALARESGHHIDMWL